MKPNPILVLALIGALTVTTGSALAGPPYVSDDPEPTDFTHYEIYLYTAGTNTRDGTSGAAGVDFNYGAAPDLQLTAVFPIEYEAPNGSGIAAGPGNTELAAKYRFIRGAPGGWDIAFFPRLFLASPSAHVGERHNSLLLPIWFGKSWGNWSTFGGGGYTIHRGGQAQDFGLLSWALTRQILRDLNLGVEIVHQTADTIGGRSSTGIGAGLVYDLTENVHCLAYAGRGIQNPAWTNKMSWYASILFTF